MVGFEVGRVVVSNPFSSGGLARAIPILMGQGWGGPKRAGLARFATLRFTHPLLISSSRFQGPNRSQLPQDATSKVDSPQKSF